VAFSASRAEVTPRSIGKGPHGPTVIPDEANQHRETRRSPLAALRRESSGKDLPCLRADSAHER
jgi:hypothetical protein